MRTRTIESTYQSFLHYKTPCVLIYLDSKKASQRGISLPHVLRQLYYACDSNDKNTCLAKKSLLILYSVQKICFVLNFSSSTD